MKLWTITVAALSALPAISCSARNVASDMTEGRAGARESEEGQAQFARRPFQPFLDGRWIGNGISYGPYRDGQTPDGGPGPSKAELREDLQLMSKHWNLIRMYGAQGPAETVLELIHEEQFPMKVMVGAWIAPETRLAEDGTVAETLAANVAGNRREVETAIRLANRYPEIVVGVSVGNETQVSWSFHKVRTSVLVDYIRQVRSATNAPVTTADDFTFWDKPESKVVAREVDFIVMHAYAMWCGQPFDNAMPFTKEQFAVVSALHPDHPVVLGEAGWATKVHAEGEQAKLIIGKAGEDEQKAFYDAYVDWTTRAQVTNFYFEAFDENWKGGAHPDEVEKHWGLFRADRSPKKAMQGDG
jgi:exo-beta-1,3-glucanase (GH17 family)